jgi:hypothetical protein
MRLTVSTTLACSPEWAWRKVREPATLLRVASPLLRFELVEPTQLPDLWEDGVYQVKLSMFGVIPAGAQYVVITDIEADDSPGNRRYSIRDNGYGDLANRWDHVITLRENPDGTTFYTDTVDIEAGMLTLGVWLFASVFYRYRQMRWRKLVSQFSSNK